MSNEDDEEKDNNSKEITVTNFRGSPKVLQISKGNYYYLINREKYDITKIMMLINYNRLSTLGQKFKEYDGGIEKIIFCTLLTNILKSDNMPVNELTDMIYGIYKFFAEIDFNGDNNMEWAEFTQFVIDKVEGENNINEERKKNRVALSEKEILKYKRYEISQSINDVHIHKSDIVNAFYINKNNKLLVNEYNTNLIRVYNPFTGHIENNINFLTINERSNNVKFLELKKILTYNKKCSVISFTATEVIIAILLSNKYILFFSTFNFKECDLIFYLKAKSLQKRIWYLEKHNMWISSGDKESDDDCYFINELDIKFENKSGDQIPITNNMTYITKYCYICKHKEEIYDVIEINKPFLILTACLDGLIRLINTKDLEFLKTWKYHTSGVKHLDYNPYLESNGYIISTGFEYNINLYCTDLSLDSSFKGKLEGHFVPLIDCKFINNTPMCASVDEEGNIRIWDTLVKICLQSIPNTKKNLLVNGLLIMHKINKFIIYGNNMAFFESKYRENREDSGEFIEENYPIKICYNKYYQQFYVATSTDIRIFDKYGILVKRFKKLLENEHFELGTRIRHFIFDNNYRKFYLGFSNGAIIQYNAGNGSAIKIINQIEYERNGILYYKYHHNRDITNLYYYYSKNELDQETILLFSTSLDSTIQIYDERDYDNSIKLKTYLNSFTVNKRKCEINCMDYNSHLSQLATGSTFGIIVIWNFNNMKINDVFYLNQKYWGMRLDVIYIKYLGKYPLLFSSYSEGICIIWTVKPLNGEAILKFQNFYQTLFKLDTIEVSCCCFYEDCVHNVEEKYLNKIYFVDEPQFIEERNKPRYDKVTGDLLPLIKRDDVERPSETDEKLDPYNDENKGDKSYYLLICDKKGYMKVLNLSGLFHMYITSAIIEKDTTVNFSLLKKENIDVGPTEQHFIKISYYRQEKAYQKLFTNLYTSHIITSEWKGHSDSVTDLAFIEDPVCTVTVSKDKFLRIWNENFDLIGELNVLPDETNINRNIKENVEWKFKVNEKKLLEKEVAEFVRILENIEINEETKIIKGSQIDIDFNDPKKYEIDDKEGLIPRREKTTTGEEYKTLNKQEYTVKSNTNVNEVKDDTDFQSNYEALMVKNIANKIEFIIKNQAQKEGMGELSNNLMNSIIENKEKLDKLKKLRINDFNRLNTYKDIEKIKEEKRNSFFSFKKGTQNKSKSNSNYSNQDEQIILKENLLKPINFEKKKSYNIKRLTGPSYETLFKNKTINGNFRGKGIDVSKNIKYEQKPLARTSESLHMNKSKGTLSDVNILIIGDKNASFNKGNHTLNRNSLYSKKFAYKSFYNPTDKNKEKEKYGFPKIHNKILDGKIGLSKNLNFEARKRTDDLIKTQYYFSNYKNCVKIVPNYSDFSSNQSNLYNYKNMWNDIKLFTKEMINKEKNKQKTFNFNKPFRKLYKSKSALDVKSC